MTSVFDDISVDKIFTLTDEEGKKYVGIVEKIKTMVTTQRGIKHSIFISDQHYESNPIFKFLLMKELIKVDFNVIDDESGFKVEWKGTAVLDVFRKAQKRKFKKMILKESKLPIKVEIIDKHRDWQFDVKPINWELTKDSK